jgi:hypothetical protein
MYRSPLLFSQHQVNKGASRETSIDWLTHQKKAQLFEKRIVRFITPYVVAPKISKKGNTIL